MGSAGPSLTLMRPARGSAPVRTNNSARPCVVGRREGLAQPLPSRRTARPDLWCSSIRRTRPRPALDPPECSDPHQVPQPSAERPIAAGWADRERGRARCGWTVDVAATQLGGSPSISVDLSLQQEEQSVTLMRFDPVRELDRHAEQSLSAGARALHSTPMRAMRLVVDDEVADQAARPTGSES